MKTSIPNRQPTCPADHRAPLPDTVVARAGGRGSYGIDEALVRVAAPTRRENGR